MFFGRSTWSGLCDDELKEIALHLLDIAQNSVTAGATELTLSLAEHENILTMTVADNGRGMTADFLANVLDPFTTTRTTRKVGLGLPLLRLSAEQTGGSLAIESAPGMGTTTTAFFHLDHIDCPPLGDVAGTLALFLQGAPETLETRFIHETDHARFELDTREVRALLCGVPLSEPEVALWLRDYIAEQELHLEKENSPNEEHGRTQGHS